MISVRTVLGSALILILSGASAAAAQTGWTWDPSSAPPGYDSWARAGRDPREGKIEAAHFVGNGLAPSELGHGPVEVISAPGSLNSNLEDDVYRAAVSAQLTKAGYTSASATGPRGQLAEVSVSHGLIEPAQPPHSPVSGGVSVGTGNRGSGLGIAVAVDLSKPAKALVLTRIEARIRDASTHQLLWKGHAEVVTREGDRHWATQTLASRLASALFKNFPDA